MMLSSFPLYLEMVEDSEFSWKRDELVAISKRLWSLADGKCAERDSSPAREDYDFIFSFLKEAKSAWTVIS